MSLDAKSMADEHQNGPTANAEWIIFGVAASFGIAIFFLVVFAAGLA